MERQSPWHHRLARRIPLFSQVRSDKLNADWQFFFLLFICRSPQKPLCPQGAFSFSACSGCCVSINRVLCRLSSSRRPRHDQRGTCCSPQLEVTPSAPISLSPTFSSRPSSGRSARPISSIRIHGGRPTMRVPSRGRPGSALSASTQSG